MITKHQPFREGRTHQPSRKWVVQRLLAKLRSYKNHPVALWGRRGRMYTDRCYRSVVPPSEIQPCRSRLPRGLRARRITYARQETLHIKSESGDLYCDAT